MIGMFTAAQNRDRLAKMQARRDTLRRKSKRTTAEDLELDELVPAIDELNGWLIDLWRIEGGGAR